MKVFHCDHCDQLVFFENTHCVKCGRVLAFLPDRLDVVSLEAESGRWRSPQSPGRLYRLCRNYYEARICNWALAEEDPDPLCQSCRLTRVIPALDVPGHVQAWFRLEVAKRRLVYTLLSLGLPLGEGADAPAFEFKADMPDGDSRVLTGHAEGVITVNVAEADDAVREQRKAELGEPYRTLLGHFRHEIGHYYWTRLIGQAPARLEEFRRLFGDERVDYAEALRQYYAAGAPGDWQSSFVTAYAAAHPWEDWAETWAHYLHMTDTLEMAASCGFSLRPTHPGDPSLRRVPDAAGTSGLPFEELVGSWFPVTYVLNNLNRGLGLPDGYPFVLPDRAIGKLRFVHDTIMSVDVRRRV